MIGAAWTSGEVLHEGRRTFRGGVGALAMFGQLTAMVALATGWSLMSSRSS